MRTMNNRKRKKRLRNLICIAICTMILLVTVLIIHMLTDALKKDEPIAKLPVSQPDTEQLISGTEISSEVDHQETNSLIVCIDAGHGGKDIGSDSDGRIEKDDALAIALAVESYLKSQNINVVMTRSEDIFWKLSKRCSIANEANADYFVSLHRNKGEGYGVEAWIAHDANAETEALGNNIMSALEAVGISRNRGVKYGSQNNSQEDLIINRDSNMPSCILELGFLNVADDNKDFDEHLEEYAKAIGDAIIQTAQTYQPDKLEGMHIEAPADTETTDGSAEASTDNSGVFSTSHTITNEQIADVASLDNTNQDWGQGSNVDEQNRPTGSLAWQEKYGKYNAYFIGEGENTIYLTFDEGYEYGCTPSILDTLKEKNVKAIFFITEPYAKAEPELVQRMIDEGHTLGNHSVTHPANGLPSQTIEQQQSEVMDNHEYVKEHFNYEMHLFRYPAGKFSEQSLAVLNNCNYKSLFWSFAYKDYDVNNQPDPAESLQKLVDKLHPGALYLLHAESQTNTDILGDFIDKARAAGYEFALFD